MKNKEKIDILLEKLYNRIHNANFNNKEEYKELLLNKALWHILTEYKDKLPELNDYFHKAFRQCDITESGHIDMVIHSLLDASTIFWEIFEKLK